MCVYNLNNVRLGGFGIKWVLLGIGKEIGFLGGFGKRLEILGFGWIWEVES